MPMKVKIRDNRPVRDRNRVEFPRNGVSDGDWRPSSRPRLRGRSRGDEAAQRLRPWPPGLDLPAAPCLTALSGAPRRGARPLRGDSRPWGRGDRRLVCSGRAIARVPGVARLAVSDRLRPRPRRLPGVRPGFSRLGRSVATSRLATLFRPGSPGPSNPSGYRRRPPTRRRLRARPFPTPALRPPLHRSGRPPSDRRSGQGVGAGWAVRRTTDVNLLPLRRAPADLGSPPAWRGVDVWRGGSGGASSGAGSFDRPAPEYPHRAPVPHPVHRTGRTDLKHPVLGLNTHAALVRSGSPP